MQHSTPTSGYVYGVPYLSSQTNLYAVVKHAAYV